MEEQTTSELDVLYRISQALLHLNDVSELVQEVFEILNDQMGMQRGTLTLRRPQTDILVIEASKGLTADEQRRGQYQVGEGITGRVAETGEPALIPDITHEPSFLDRTRSRGNVEMAFLCVPIIHQRDVIGTISIDRPSAPLLELENDLSFLKIVAHLLAEAVSNIHVQVEERELLLEENRQLRLEVSGQYRPDNIIGNCTSMRAVYKLIAQLARSPATVLVRGESGTGKELVARALHYASDRKAGPFIGVNVAALPENLVESELFGHEKGAFTTALKQRQGRFELANGGTLFLDEIGDIPHSVQLRLLRVLQERVFERVGGTEPISVNVRIIAATSRNLETAIVDERFREDLYYRLNVCPIHIPPLRERRSDIVLLADHFLETYNRTYSKRIRRISTPAINMMMAYHWPGNVRELENCIEWAVLTSNDNVIHGYNLPPSLQTAKATHTQLVPDTGDVNIEALVRSFEREIIVDSLKTNRGNCTATARDLGTTQRKLTYRVNQLGINPKSFR